MKPVELLGKPRKAYVLGTQKNWESFRRGKTIEMIVYKTWRGETGYAPHRVPGSRLKKPLVGGYMRVLLRVKPKP